MLHRRDWRWRPESRVGYGGNPTSRCSRRRSASQLIGKRRWADLPARFVAMAKALRVLRWVAMALLLLLAARGAWALALDALRWGMATDEIRHVAPGVSWTAFERCIDYNLIADRDTVLYLARAIHDEATWYRIAPTDTHLDGPMIWVTPTRLRIPAAYRDGCLRGLDDVVIEWSSQ